MGLSSRFTSSPELNPSPLIIGGPSGIGKTRMVSGLIAKQPGFFRRPRSVTTRERRRSEDTSEYEFISRDSVLTMASRGELLNLDRVYGEYYGVTLDSIRDLLSQGLMPVKEIHPRNFWKFLREYPTTLTIMLLHSPESPRPPQEEPRASVRDEDASFYSNPEVLEVADVTLFRSHFSTESDLLQHIENCAYLNMLYPDFPRAVEIDRVNREGYQSVASEFTDDRRLTTANFHALTKPFFSNAVRGLLQETRSLEIGPGRGWLRESVDSWPSSIDHQSLELVTEMKTSDPEIRVGSVRMLPYRTGYFDTVLSSLGDPYCYPLALCEIHRVLRAGGNFFFSAPSALWSRGLRCSETSRRTSFVLSDGREASVFSFTYELAELLDLFRACGFVIQSAEETSVGSQLLDPLSEAITSAAAILRVPYQELPLVNTVHARAAG